MNAHPLFPVRVSFAVTFFLLFFGCGYCQTAPTADSAVTIITSVLRDGTKIWGTLQSEAETGYTVFDFNLGEVHIAKADVSNEGRESVASAVIIETANNASYFGYIIGATPTSLILRSDILDRFEIQTSAIVRITASGNYVSKRGQNWFANPNATRYFFAPSAIPLKKKEGYFQNAYLIANSVNIGVTNNISIGGGIVIPVLFYITPKISYQLNKYLYVGAGVLFTQAFISDLNLSAGVGYGLITLGSREHNVTVGGGYGFARTDSNYQATKMPIVTVNGMTRIGKRLSLVSENWIIPRSTYNEERMVDNPNGMPYAEMVPVDKDYYTFAGSLGLRIMPGLKTSIDFSVVSFKPNPTSGYLFLPYLDFVYKFN